MNLTIEEREETREPWWDTDDSPPAYNEHDYWLYRAVVTNGSGKPIYTGAWYRDQKEAAEADGEAFLTGLAEQELEAEVAELDEALAELDEEAA